MCAQSAEQLTLGFVVDRPLVVKRVELRMSSDAGLIPIAEFDRRWGFTQRMAECLTDQRRRPQHSLVEMIRQRLFGILADYEDCNDHDDLRDDPVFKLTAGRLPADDPLAAQPTLSRFENSVTPLMLEKLKRFLVSTGIERLKEKHDGRLPAEVTLDIDPTDAATHGRQQLTLFHGYYDQYQYLPQIITEPTTQHVFLAQLRHGTMHPARGADADLMEVAEPLRRERPDLAIHVRGDSDFGNPVMYKVCETQGFSYIFGLTSNPKLVAMAQPLMESAIARQTATGKKQRLFTAFRYRAASWDRSRTVIAKAEVNSIGTNLRFVVTNQWVASDRQAEQRYDEYIQRGTSEQRNDELKNGLSADRLSCHRFMANFWRLLLHVCAYNLLNALRDADEIPSELRTAQPARWRTRLIKVAARVIQSTRRVVVEVSAAWPYWPVVVTVTRRALACQRAP